MLILAAAVILACVFIGWSIGANDAANCVGADIGSGRITLREGIIITALFGFLGALLIGQNVIKTVGKGIVPLHLLDPKLALLIALAACFGAGIWVVLATFLRLPVSTSHSIVGAVGGAGLAIGAPVIWGKLGNIFISWVATPFGSALLALIMYYPFRFLFYLLTPPLLRAWAQRWLLILTSCYLAFTWGGNDVANATGVILGVNITTPLIATLIGAGAIVLGIVTMGYRVIETVGYKITRLLPIMAIVAEIASAGNVHLYTHFGIPVSTSHSIVGAVAGAGLAMGTPVIWSKILDIFICWVLTPLGAAIIAFLLYYPFRRIFYFLVPKRSVDIFLKIFIYATSIYLAFTWGANDVANVTGVIAGTGIISPFAATVLGALAITLGVITWGRRVIETVGFNITHLVPMMGIVAEIASGLNVHLYTMLGVPVSTSHSMVGAVLGVGLVRGVKSIQKSVIRDIILAWSLTPFLAGLISFLLMKAIIMTKLI